MSTPEWAHYTNIVVSGGHIANNEMCSLRTFDWTAIEDFSLIYFWLCWVVALPESEFDGL